MEGDGTSFAVKKGHGTMCCCLRKNSKGRKDKKGRSSSKEDHKKIERKWTASRMRIRQQGGRCKDLTSGEKESLPLDGKSPGMHGATTKRALKGKKKKARGDGGTREITGPLVGSRC